VKPARGDTIDPRMLYVIDGDTLALAGERIRLLGIDAPETRDDRCERERVAGYETKARVVDLLRFGRSVEIRRQGHDQYGRTLAHILIDGRNLGEQLVREKRALPYRSSAEAIWSPSINEIAGGDLDPVLMASAHSSACVSSSLRVKRVPLHLACASTGPQTGR
jgi:endonuclease YncB( thermonuclease family)